MKTKSFIPITLAIFTLVGALMSLPLLLTGKVEIWLAALALWYIKWLGWIFFAIFLLSEVLFAIVADYKYGGDSSFAKTHPAIKRFLAERFLWGIAVGIVGMFLLFRIQIPLLAVSGFWLIFTIHWNRKWRNMLKTENIHSAVARTRLEREINELLRKSKRTR